MPAVNKLVLAVHGIGDQAANSTILSTATQFCNHYGYRALLPLGGFSDVPTTSRPAFVVSGPGTPDHLGSIGFAEIYWADIAREIEVAGYTLEETKAWCRSVVSRVRVLAERREPGRTDIHYDQIAYVIDEAIDAIGVIEALLFLARKAGVFDFSLKDILDNYLGDVQLVTEFAHVRDQIVAKMELALEITYDANPDAEIYIVAHSEGTVVAFLGLLWAAKYPKRHAWIKNVKGFMTLGSPIDKHLILWPDLFTEFTGPDLTGIFGPSPVTPPAAGAPDRRIRWLNYVDNGDPVGFELDTARWWMGQHGYDQVFNFTPNDDYYFTRYYVPGKAHTDYWDDADVFQHFIMTVVDPPKDRTDPPPIERREALKNGPRPRFWARITSYVVAYLIPLVAVFAAVYFLSKGVEQYLDPKGDQDHDHLIRNVFALGGLLAGMTVWLRITQLVRSRWWHLGGGLIFVVFARFFWVLMKETPDLSWLNTLPSLLGDPWTDPHVGLTFASAAMVILVMLSNARWLRRVWSLIFPKTMSLGAVDTSTRPSPVSPTSSEGQKAPAPTHPPLIRNTLGVMLTLGAVALVANTIVYSTMHPHDRAALWPIMMAGAAFLYLWRLSALVFDLIFIWHRYIRHSGVMNFLRHSILPPGAEKASPAAGGKAK